MIQQEDPVESLCGIRKIPFYENSSSIIIKIQFIVEIQLMTIKKRNQYAFQ